MERNQERSNLSFLMGVNMQDRFKFRAWNIANQKYCHFATMDISADGLLRVIRPLEESSYIADYENRYIIQQCTGLKDKNGKLIYEGDIVNFNCDSEIIRGIVKWAELPPAYYVECLPDTNDKYCVDWDLYTFDDTIQVIGNIYENPELLEVRDENNKE